MKLATLGVLLFIVAHVDLDLHQMVVVAAFLNGTLDENIFTEEPDGCVDTSEHGLSVQTSGSNVRPEASPTYLAWEDGPVSHC